MTLVFVKLAIALLALAACRGEPTNTTVVTLLVPGQEPVDISVRVPTSYQFAYGRPGACSWRGKSGGTVYVWMNTDSDLADFDGFCLEHKLRCDWLDWPSRIDHERIIHCMGEERICGTFHASLRMNPNVPRRPTWVDWPPDDGRE